MCVPVYLCLSSGFVLLVVKWSLLILRSHTSWRGRYCYFYAITTSPPGSDRSFSLTHTHTQTHSHTLLYCLAYPKLLSFSFPPTAPPDRPHPPTPSFALLLHLFLPLPHLPLLHPNALGLLPTPPAPQRKRPPIACCLPRPVCFRSLLARTSDEGRAGERTACRCGFDDRG